MSTVLLPELQPERLKETTLDSEPVFQGRFLHIQRDTVSLPGGQRASREYVIHPGAAMVIPLLDDGQVVVERQYRYPLQRAMIEFPAGKLDGGESSWCCAQRELLEETGYQAAEWAYAGVLHPVISYATEFIDIWFARGLTQHTRCLDDGEFLDVLTVTPEVLTEACRTGVVTDAKTLTGMLWLQNVLRGEWSLRWQSAAIMATGSADGQVAR